MLRRQRLTSLPAVAAILLLAGPAAARAAIWPDHFNGAAIQSVQPLSLPDKPLAEEYGFDAGERADYGAWKAAAYRTKDSTGALAVYQWLAGDLPPASNLVLYGNYVFRFDGPKPPGPELQKLYATLPQLDQSPLPTLTGFFPSAGLVPHSQRYVLGPVSLARFFPGIPPSVAAFHLSAEAQVGTFHQKSGEVRLAVFSYPTPAIARQQLAAFQKLSGAVVKRDGPLVAVISPPANADDAELVLSKLKYHASIIWDEKTPTNQAHDVANMILSIFALCGIVLGFCLFAGLAYAGIRVLRRQVFGKENAEGAMILLHLEDR